MAEKKSAAPSHPPYAALVREAILALKVASGSFAASSGSRCVSKAMLDLLWMLLWTQPGAACLEKRCRLADDVELRAGAKWLVPASHHEVRGREASSLARTLEEGALQPCTEAQGFRQARPGATVQLTSKASRDVTWRLQPSKG